MNTSGTVYRIFVSSCVRLLEEERRILSDTILKNMHLPIQMEFQFSGSNSEYSLEIDTKKIEDADCAIFILSYLYGELIGEKVSSRESCPLKNEQLENCEACRSKTGCRLSFTQFEYEYAKCLKKPIVVILNKYYSDDERFIVENEKYKTLHNGEDCLSAYYCHKEKNSFFVADIIKKHTFPYTDMRSFQDACMRAVDSAVDSIRDYENLGIFKPGLVPYNILSKSEEKVEEIEKYLEQMKAESIEAAYDSQTSALNALETEAKENWRSIYLNSQNQLADIRVLAIRGASFAGPMGHEWTRFILDEEFKGDVPINIEFILSNSSNEPLVRERYDACRNRTVSADEQSYEVFKAGYKRDMESVQNNIQNYKRTHPLCELYLHDEPRLPFRMVFMGKYLYLSTFLDSTKAVDSSVVKIPYTSILYKVCDEYYNWVKQNSNKYRTQL